MIMDEENQLLYMGLKEFNIKNYSLQTNCQRRKKIKTKTIYKNQSECELWKLERSTRITDSNFVKVCKLQATTSRKNIVKNILYNNFSEHLATDYSIKNEPLAKTAFEK